MMFILKLKGQKISGDNYVFTMEARELQPYLLNFLDEIMYYNISLSNDIYVVLAVGHGKFYKAVRLGTSTSTQKAIVKSQKEVMQYFATAFSKNRRVEKDLLENKHSDKDIYHQNFGNLSIEDLINSYSYFEGSPEFSLVNQDKHITSEIIHNNHKRLHMSSFIAMFESKLARGVKVVRIVNLNWFPNMAPRTYPKENIKNVEKIIKYKRKSFSEILPFA